ncbi:MAG: undecaprenyl-diphosphate phosphatase [Alphaproteobacteria bacterium]|nr:undecaprenyl-diphosphate phosphatase [Alphaproteobacteria bacterium]
MTDSYIFYLSLLQGLTEFLPVSSSGHLILLSKFTFFPDQGLTLDVAVHVGSILAVLIYFSDTLWQMAKSLIKTKFLPDFNNEGSRLFWFLIIGSIPAFIAGFLLKSYGMEWLRNTRIIGWTILGYGILLYIADSCSMTIRQIKHMTVFDAVMIGLAQCLSLIPGTSRSGITITMARFLGLERREAAKFSMLLSIPAIIGAAILTGWEIFETRDFSNINWIFDGVIYSYLASLVAIYIVMWWLKKSTFLPFVLYRIVLGTILLLDSYQIYSING